MTEVMNRIRASPSIVLIREELTKIVSREPESATGRDGGGKIRILFVTQVRLTSENKEGVATRPMTSVAMILASDVPR